MIPFLDLAAASTEIGNELKAATNRVVDRGWYILGEEVERFESEFAAYVGARHCIAVGNGLDALNLSFRGLGIGPGDEVIVPSNTFIATWLGVTYAGATPVPVEPDPTTYNLDPAAVEAAITPRTRAICPVHLYGLPADLPAIVAVAERHGLAVVEDAAQAHGAGWGGRMVGGTGTTATWSFYPGKNLGALGDGGAVTTDDDDLAARLRTLRNYGSSKKYVHEEQGLNSRLDEIQAAALRVKLNHLPEWNLRRAEVADTYLRDLAEVGLVLPSTPDGVRSSWHLFVVRSERRDDLQAALSARSVQTLIHYPIPPHLQGAYAGAFRSGQFPVSERIHRTVLSLPIGPHLASDAVDKVVTAVCDAVAATAST
ncbi:DegT/DnrJ/EryC1/StrS family aminotransferase [Nocardioides dongkuii]|uniref:DegT/DnrJ/EryC1/StrS family aminotransferase n=1 Tax=Nocardioides dongkuii TaxID=2760089 RepID=UPI0015FA07B1|nr:DegT/DnrJ/EryC1/StrS family aminotransferase [Nocardioides dongkuii]